MDLESIVFVAAFLGSMFGLPAGFLLIQIIKLITSKVDSRGDAESDLLEWSIAQPGCIIVDETQVANNWVRTMDVARIDIDQRRSSGIESNYVTQTIGGAGAPKPVPAMTAMMAQINHDNAVAALRKRLGLQTI